jgi:hypothetical protein
MKPIDTKNFELEAKFLFESHANIGLLALSASIQFSGRLAVGVASGRHASAGVTHCAVTGVAVVYI